MEVYQLHVSHVMFLRVLFAVRALESENFGTKQIMGWRNGAG